MRKLIYLLALTGLVITAEAAQAQSTQAVISDSRIKTFVYNENDVFSLLTHYGYQCNIEFGPKEEIETISVGDRVGWQVIPAGRRLFIRALTENAQTNMTVVTSRHAYQFDLRSSGSQMRPNEELVYVVRFFYPGEQSAMQQSLVAASDMLSGAGFAPPARGAENYNYTMTGPEQFAPTRIFDDGQSTYFRFPPQITNVPAILLVKPDGTEAPLSPRQSNGYVVVPVTAARFSLRMGNEVICVYNEAVSGVAQAP